VLFRSNAGKSTLISVLSSARPKVADYPFTTLVPNLGVVRKDTGDGVVFADIPGLIAGAHLGAGLGHDFLRHIERTRLLLHVVDGASEDPRRDYNTVRAELDAYGHGLDQRPQILVLNKYDSVQTQSPEELLAPFGDLDCPKVVISAATRYNLEPLLRLCWQELEALQPSIK